MVNEIKHSALADFYCIPWLLSKSYDRINNSASSGFLMKSWSEILKSLRTNLSSFSLFPSDLYNLMYFFEIMNSKL